MQKKLKKSYVGCGFCPNSATNYRAFWAIGKSEYLKVNGLNSKVDHYKPPLTQSSREKGRFTTINGLLA